MSEVPDPKPISYGVHCDGLCPYLAPYGKENDLTAICKLTGGELTWYDYWIASECVADFTREIICLRIFGLKKLDLKRWMM